MSNKKLEFQKIESKTTWDNFVQSQPRYSFIQSWGYTEVLTTLSSQINRVGVFQDGELVALLPIAIVRARRGNYIRLRHGPILSTRAQDPTTFAQIVEYLKAIAVREGLSFVRAQTFGAENLFETNRFLPAPTHNLDAEHTLQLDLSKFRTNDMDKTQKQIQNNMRKNTRYYIRKAFKEGIVVTKDNMDFETFFSILKSTAGRQSYTTWPRSYFEALFSNFSDSELSLYFAEFQGKRIGIGLFLDYGKYRFYLEGGMLVEYSNYYPAYAIQWTSIQDALYKNVEIYDFWGGVSPKDANGESMANYPWAGIDLFKRGFGGEEKSMMHPHDLKINSKYWITYMFEKLEKWKRGY